MPNLPKKPKFCSVNPASPLNRGLLRVWPFSPSGTVPTELREIAGAGLNGTLVNMDDTNWVYGELGAGLSFNGVDERVSLPPTALVQGRGHGIETPSNTLMLVATLDPAGTGARQTLACAGRTDGNAGFSIDVDTAGFAAIHYTFTDGLVSSTCFVMDGLPHVFMVTDGPRLYVDGRLVLIAHGHDLNPQANGISVFGCNNAAFNSVGNRHWFKGTIWYAQMHKNVCLDPTAAGELGRDPFALLRVKRRLYPGSAGAPAAYYRLLQQHLGLGA